MSDNYATQRRISLRVAVWAVAAAIALHVALQIWEFMGVDSGWTVVSPYSTESLVPTSFRVYQLLSFSCTVAWWAAAVAGVWNLRVLNVFARERAAHGCPQCEYDSANPSASTCPKCGGSLSRETCTSPPRQSI